MTISTIGTNGLNQAANTILCGTSGNVGIGTSSPDVVSGYKALCINGTTGGLFYFKSNGTNVTQISGDSTGTTLYTLGGQDLLLGTNNTERARFDTIGNFKFNSGYGSVATAYGCRAWVNFNGTGTVAIRRSANVSSITDNGVGQYTANFTTAMVDTTYIATGSASGNATTRTILSSAAVLQTTAACSLDTGAGGTVYDCPYVFVAFHR